MDHSSSRTKHIVSLGAFTVDVGPFTGMKQTTFRRFSSWGRVGSPFGPHGGDIDAKRHPNARSCRSGTVRVASFWRSAEYLGGFLKSRPTRLVLHSGFEQAETFP